MKTLKSLLLIALVSILALYFFLPIACGDDDDDDDDSSDDGSDVCADFCDILAYCDMDEDLNVYTMDECLDFCLQVGTVGNCVIDAADCEAARACFEEEGDDDTEDTCPEGEIWDEQLGECIPEECGLDRYPDAPFDDKALLYVDTSYTGESDGSAEKPYKTIAEAISNAGENTSILLAAGDYVELETLAIELDGLNLVGRCPYLTKVRSAEGRTVLRVDDSNSNLINGISFYAEGESEWTLSMIKLSETSGTEFSDNTVMDSTGEGLKASNCDGILISNNVLKNNAEYGIYFNKTTGTISDNIVEGNFGMGMCALHSEQVTVSGNIVEGNTEYGIIFEGVNGMISGNEVRDTKPNEQGENGRGINIQESEQVSVSDNIVEGNTEAGIFFVYASGTISGNEVRDTRLNGQSKVGYGIYIQHSEDVLVSDTIVESNADIGIAYSSASGTISGNIVESNASVGIVFLNSSGTISGNEVCDTKPNEQGELGHGISVQESEQVSVSDNIVEGNTQAGIAFFNANGTISGNEVRDSRLNGQGKFGYGIYVEDSEDILVSDNIAEDNTSVGIIIANIKGPISGNQVRVTRPNGQGEFGRGIEVRDSEQISLVDNIVEDNTALGIGFHNVSGTISRNEVRGTLPGNPNEEGYTFGHGIHVQVSTDVECSSNIVENNVHTGIYYFLSENGNIYENQVRGTTAGLRDTFNFGDGIAVVDTEGFISIQDNTLDGNDRCGILTDSSTGMIERNGIFGNENSIVAQNGSDMNVSDNDIHDNDINDVQFFEGRELDVNDSMIERNGMIE